MLQSLLLSANIRARPSGVEWSRVFPFLDKAEKMIATLRGLHRALSSECREDLNPVVHFLGEDSCR